MKKYEPQKFKLRLICVNCGMLAMYEIPVRRVFYDYQPEGHQPPFGEWADSVHSHYEFPNGKDWTPVICGQCNVPMLVRTPINAIMGPPIETVHVPPQ